MIYKTRRDQIEKDFLPQCLKDPTRRVIKKELRGAAMVGACEERERTLGIIERACGDLLRDALVREITSVGVLEVLGYKK